MLELRPTCEHCNTALPPASTLARICSFECTFCANCVDNVLDNVCPNCGGGFTARPIRPSRDWKNGNTVGKYPPSATVKHRRWTLPPMKRSRPPSAASRRRIGSIGAGIPRPKKIAEAAHIKAD